MFGFIVVAFALGLGGAEMEGAELTAISLPVGLSLDGEPDAEYKSAVKRRFVQWVIDVDPRSS